MEIKAYTFLIKEEMILYGFSKATIVKRQIPQNGTGYIHYIYLNLPENANINITLRTVDLNNHEDVYQIYQNKQLSLRVLFYRTVENGILYYDLESCGIKISNKSTIFIDINNNDAYLHNVKINFFGYEILNKQTELNN